MVSFVNIELSVEHQNEIVGLNEIEQVMLDSFAYLVNDKVFVVNLLGNTSTG